MKIESLTAEQISRFPEFVKRWTDIGLCTDPADRPRAEAAVRKCYEIAGLAAPKRIVWCGSPMSQGLTRAIVMGLDGKAAVDVGKHVKASVWDSVGASVWASVGASVWASVGASVRASVGASVGDSVWDSVWDSVRASVRASVWDSVGASVWDSVGDSVRDSVWASVGDSVRDSVGDSVWASVGASVRDSVGDSVRDSVWASVWASVGDSVRDSVWASVGASVGASVWDSVGDSVGASVWDSVGASGYGQHDANGMAFYDYFAQACGLSDATQKLCGLMELSQSANWWLPHQDICWISERHNRVIRNDAGRLHCVDGPALSYPDGWCIWSIGGVRVDEQIVMHPATQTVEQIRAEQNAEIKRIRIERFGWEAYLTKTKATVLDTRRNDVECTREALMRVDDMTVLVCHCPSTARVYTMEVEPAVKTCEQAQNFLWSGSRLATRIVKRQNLIGRS